MRHGRKVNHLSRQKGHREALLSNLANSLILSKRITTTVAKAKALRPVADKLVGAGIRGILNFAPVSITTPHDVSVQGVDLAVQLEQLSFKMSLAGEPPAHVETPPAPPVPPV